MKRILSLVLLLLPTFVGAQDIIVTPASSVGSAGILSVSHQADILSVNPALSATTKSLDAFVSYTLPYHLSEFQQVMAKAAMHTPVANISLRVAQTGGEDSRYTQIGGGLSRSFGQFGIGLEYHAIAHTLPYGMRYWSSFSRFGIYVRPVPYLTLSTALHNVERSAFNYEYSQTEIEPMAVVGVRWDARSLCSFMVEAEKRWEHEAEGKAALVIRPTRKLSAQAGFSTIGRSISMGVGYDMGIVNIGIGVSYHDKLGVTSAAQILKQNILNQQ